LDQAPLAGLLERFGLAAALRSGADTLSGMLLRVGRPKGLTLRARRATSQGKSGKEAALAKNANVGPTSATSARRPPGLLRSVHGVAAYTSFSLIASFGA
jgi:hypothetical protein